MRIPPYFIAAKLIEEGPGIWTKPLSVPTKRLYCGSPQTMC